MLRGTISHAARTTAATPHPAGYAAANPLESLQTTLRTMKISPGLHSKLADLHEHHQAGITQWVQEQVTQARREPLSMSNIYARQAAAGASILSAMQEATGFLLKYDVRADNVSLIDSLTDFHRNNLNIDFGAAYSNLSDDKKLQVALTVEPGVLEKMGIAILPISPAEIAKLQATLPAGLLLNEGEFIATIDYLSSTTKLFAAVNSAERVKAFYGLPLFADVVKGVSTELNCAIKKLSANPAYARKDVVIHKGVNLHDAAGPFRLAALENALAHDKAVPFPHTLSASENEWGSYLVTKSPELYNVGMRIKIKQGAAVDALHDASTQGEQEVVVLAGALCKVTGKSEEMIPNSAAGYQVLATIYDLEQL